MNVKLLKELTEAHGVTGQEDAIREIVRRELKNVGELEADRLGNLTCLKRGKGKKKLMIAAHMDEIGFVVKYIEDGGFLRIHPLGGWSPRQMNSQRVIVGTKKGPLRGILTYESKPKHMMTEAEEKEAQRIERFFVDVGLSGQEAKASIRLGDPITMDRDLIRLGKHLTCKTMDDRVGVFVMIEALKAAKSNEVDVYAVATVQEEIGLRGAAAAGSAIAPDIVVALDITIANDIPGMAGSDHVTKLGDGTAIKFMDSSLICHPKLFDHFRRLAEKHKIKHQVELLPLGGTDAGGVQRLHGGIPSFTLSIPTRYVHTVNETVHEDDVQASIDLLARYIEEAHKGNYSY
ncbi:MAG TPA: M20/M25/M40 family metallo-hydrolase [Fimbriimonadaceae bacterium]|nr:M20/M25/M40 family metallo-hydrolase [Fimbriimonadaceae bacterium]